MTTHFDLGDKTGIVVAFPPNTITLNDIFKVTGKRMAAEGILTSTSDSVLVGLFGKNGAKQLPLLVAEKVTWLDEKNEKRFPAENHATIEGVTSRLALTLDSITVSRGIRNGDGDIPLVVAKGTALPEAEKNIRAYGKVRVVKEQALLEAAKLRR
jgi:hypothetical protein